MTQADLVRAFAHAKGYTDKLSKPDFKRFRRNGLMSRRALARRSQKNPPPGFYRTGISRRTREIVVTDGSRLGVMYGLSTFEISSWRV